MHAHTQCEYVFSLYSCSEFNNNLMCRFTIQWYVRAVCMYICTFYILNIIENCKIRCWYRYIGTGIYERNIEMPYHRNIEQAKLVFH